MAALTAAKVVSIAANVLLKQKDEETGQNKLLIGIATGIAILLALMYAAVQLFLLPDNILTNFFLPESIREARDSVNASFERQRITTIKDSLISYPVTDTYITSGYGRRTIAGRPDLSWHEGIDFGVALGTSVASVAPGIVVDTGVSQAYGSYITIEHHMERYDKDRELIEEETFYSFYAHLYRVYVFEGQEISERQEIALSGGDPTMHYAGNTTGAHLHLELRRTTAYGSDFNPYDYIQNKRALRGETRSIKWVV